MIWVGANDGPVSVTRDNGKTWKNVTPKDLVGARIQTIEDSPHAKGRAYIAAYRFMREHDLKPYIYRTDNYGETWTLLTDGKNGIPIDHPTRVVREDPKQAGLLYAGTEFGFFVSFNAGRNWQPLQQNLPATPVTDIKVHRNDLVISTMGRSACIMDNITPLQQLAAIANGAPTAAGGHDGGLDEQTAARGALPALTHFSAARGDPLPQRHRAGIGERAGVSDDGCAVRSVLRNCAGADTKLEVPTHAAARSARGTCCHRAAPAPARRRVEAAEASAGGGSSPGIRAEAGMQRITWDLRYPGPWAPNTPDGGPGGPMVPPGKYSVRLTAGGQTITRTFDLKSDPRVAADGVTDGDIAEQVKFQLQVRDAISDARKLQQSIEQAMQKAGVKPQLAPGAVGSSPGDHQVRQRAAAALREGRRHARHLHAGDADRLS